MPVAQGFQRPSINALIACKCIKMTECASGLTRFEPLIEFPGYRNLPQGDGLSMTTPNQPYVPICAICGKPCNFEECKVTYDGKPVHDDCIVTLLLEKKAEKS